jgi:hypothetical protein
MFFFIFDIMILQVLFFRLRSLMDSRTCFIFRLTNNFRIYNIKSFFNRIIKNRYNVARSIDLIRRV